MWRTCVLQVLREMESASWIWGPPYPRASMPATSSSRSDRPQRAASVWQLRAILASGSSVGRGAVAATMPANAALNEKPRIPTSR